MKKSAKKKPEAPLTPAERAKRYRVRLSRLGARRFVLMVDGGELALVAVVAKSMNISMTEAIRTLMRRGIAELPQDILRDANMVEQAYRAAQAAGKVPL